MTKILVIEDDPLMARLYEKAFNLEGYEVLVAYGGEEGLKMTEEEKPALVLLDIMMPDMDGIQFLEALRANPSIKSIPVVALTNLAADRDAEAVLAKGAVKYIVKSEHEPKEVVDIVKEILVSDKGEKKPKTLS